MLNGSVILICGKICAGKTIYARELLKVRKGVLLSCDELMLSFRGLFADARHDEALFLAQKYLFNKSLEIVSQGLDVVLDWGFWRRADRENALDFYRKKGVNAQVHYLEADDSTLAANIARRNAITCKNESDAYFVNDGLLEKCEKIFEPPFDDESDVIKIKMNRGKII